MREAQAAIDEILIHPREHCTKRGCAASIVVSCDDDDLGSRLRGAPGADCGRIAVIGSECAMQEISEDDQSACGGRMHEPAQAFAIVRVGTRGDGDDR